MTIDVWNPATFCAEITAALHDHSTLVSEYHIEDRRLMDEHLRSVPYESLKPNHHFSDYRQFHEHVFAPIVSRSRVRAWHYTRTTDSETASIRRRLVLSSLEQLSQRLEALVRDNLLSMADAKIIYAQSPFHEQLINREGRLWTTVIPLPPSDGGVEPLLESWGGESAYFWLSDQRILAILKRIGSPRIVEIETGLSDNSNGYSVADVMLKVWARHLGVPINISGCDLSITGCIDSARVLRVHTDGDDTFSAVGLTYPVGVGPLLIDQVGQEYDCGDK